MHSLGREIVLFQFMREWEKDRWILSILTLLSNLRPSSIFHSKWTDMDEWEDALHISSFPILSFDVNRFGMKSFPLSYIRLHIFISPTQTTLVSEYFFPFSKKKTYSAHEVLFIYS